MKIKEGFTDRSGGTMVRITRAAAHLPAEEVKQRMKTAPSVLYRQRWLIIYTAQVAPRTAAEIAKECGVSKATVHALIATYNRLGTRAVETVGKGGRHNELLSWQQERELLTTFFARATEGQIATAGEIQRAYEQRVGHPVHQSTAYRSQPLDLCSHGDVALSLTTLYAH